MKKESPEKVLKLELEGYAADVVTEAAIKHLYESIYELIQYPGFRRMDDDAKETVYDVIESLRTVLYYLLQKNEALDFFDKVQRQYTE
jgi:hypothetical protein